VQFTYSGYIAFMATPPKRQGDLSALLRAARTARLLDTADTAYAQRKEIADFCRYLGARLKGELNFGAPPALPPGLKLSPRMRQTLERLLAGDSEKQIAVKLAVSPHTVHVYVKSLYHEFEVCSRSELLARFVQIPASVQGSINTAPRKKPVMRTSAFPSPRQANRVRQPIQGNSLPATSSDVDVHDKLKEIGKRV
jgi:DNA-binding CsgD family transcriptional regulator